MSNQMVSKNGDAFVSFGDVVAAEAGNGDGLVGAGVDAGGGVSVVDDRQSAGGPADEGVNGSFHFKVHGVGGQIRQDRSLLPA